jgi:GT2 family glycosyltransferase
MNSYPLVSIIIVNYNGAQHLPECLDSIYCQTYPNFEVLVFDNGSQDGSLQLLRGDHPRLRVLASQQNIGYPAAINRALEHARGEYVAVLNMDVAVDPGWLEPLVECLQQHSQAGAVTPRLLLYHQPNQINALGQNVHLTALGFNRMMWHPATSGDTQPRRVSGLHGAAFMLPRRLFLDLGGMNETCFLYHEDVDLSWLLLLAGYDIYVVPGSVVRHKYRLHMRADKLYWLERNRVAMLVRHLRWGTLLLLLPFIAFTELLMAGYCLLHGWEFIQAKLRSLGWVACNWRRIMAERRTIQALRRRSDWQVLRQLRLNYDWDQFFHLGRQSRQSGQARRHIWSNTQRLLADENPRAS